MNTLTTGSKTTRWIGAIALICITWLALLALVFTPDDVLQRGYVRLLYLHLPSVYLAYLSFVVCTIGCIMYLWKRSQWWDLVAASAAEIGVVFLGLTLATGMIWGKPVWGTYWQWGDARLVTTLVLFLMYVGYVAVRSLPADPHVRSRRAAFVGLLAFVNVPIVHFSVTWWRTLHQQRSFDAFSEGGVTLDDLMLFTAFFGLVTFSVVWLWLMVHRFRVAWLEEQVEADRLDLAIEERRAEAELAGTGGAFDGGASNG